MWEPLKPQGRYDEVTQRDCVREEKEGSEPKPREHWHLRGPGRKKSPCTSLRTGAGGLRPARAGRETGWVMSESSHCKGQQEKRVLREPGFHQGQKAEEEFCEDKGEFVYNRKGFRNVLSSLLCSYPALTLLFGQNFGHIVLHVCVLGLRAGLGICILHV